MTASFQDQLVELPDANDIKHLLPDEQIIYAHYEAEGGCHWYVAGQYPDPSYMFGFVELGHGQDTRSGSRYWHGYRVSLLRRPQLS